MIPLDLVKLQSVEGIGPYIAGATICFATNTPVTLIDTNSVRVVGRVWGLNLGGEARRRKSVVDMIAAACDPQDPRNYYYALIDLAHTVCYPKTPDCKVCPLLTLPCNFGKDNLSSLED
jgi:A/G-specific adenine glycosylase